MITTGSTDIAFDVRVSEAPLTADEREGTFFEVGNTVLGVYAVNEYYSR